MNNKSNPQTVLIIGAGPAGLTAALELTRNSQIKPIVIEADDLVGGISRTVNYKGNRIDIGGHRFFSKSDWVMEWWKGILPIEQQDEHSETVSISYQGKTRDISIDDDQANGEATMLIRPRLSRIYYEGHFFDYPIKLNLNTIKNLGLFRMTVMGFSYIKAVFFPIKERNLEDFIVNRFGRKLYETFFESYTEKVWGVPCKEISPEWGAQRIKGLSVSKAISHFVLAPFRRKNSISQKGTQTSLIERFMYPKYGPGQMWETVTEMVRDAGGTVLMEHRVDEVTLQGNTIKEIHATGKNGESISFSPDYVISTMPVKDLIGAITPSAPENVAAIARGLPYRDFLTVGLLVNKLRPNSQSQSRAMNNMPPDNWIYIQDPDVQLGRVQIFNNWSPAMVADQNTIWLGLEYFCNEGDPLWEMDDDELKKFAAIELETIGLIDKEDVMDGVIIRMPKAYPAYFGTYDQFNIIQNYTNGIENLFLVGRNGMHRYNNQDHSMLAANAAVKSILTGKRDFSALWEINTEEEYHEEK